MRIVLQEDKSRLPAEFARACVAGYRDALRTLLDSEHVDREGVKEEALRYAAKCGHFDVVRGLLSLTGGRRVNVHAFDCYDSETAFTMACAQGHMRVAQCLLRLTGDRRIDVHAAREGAFVGACWHGHTDIVRMLLALDGDRRIDVRGMGHCGFSSACDKHNIDIVRMLLEQDDDRMPSRECQREHLTACAQAILPATQSLAAWRRCGVRTHVLCRPLQRMVQALVQPLLWESRALVVLARRGAQSAAAQLKHHTKRPRGW
uniref:Uncharacterized protein n=1 Tax=viral metagenome TaxID=1070528 RepID=A0A6C0ASZ6_9ZZZZ